MSKDKYVLIDLTDGGEPSGVETMTMEVIAEQNKGTIVVTSGGITMTLELRRPGTEFTSMLALIGGFEQIVLRGLETLNDIEGNEVDRDS